MFAIQVSHVGMALIRCRSEALRLRFHQKSYVNLDPALGVLKEPESRPIPKHRRAAPLERSESRSILVVTFGPAIDRLGSAMRGFGATSRVVVLCITEEFVAESSARRVLPTCRYGQIFREYRAKVTIKD
jgi:hypothetical protein